MNILKYFVNNNVKEISKEKGECKMKKSKKMILVFVMVMVALTMMVSQVKATGDLDIQIITDDNAGTTGTGTTTTNGTDTSTTDGTTTTGTDTTTTGTQSEETTPNLDENKTETLPQTGIEENTIVFVAFIAIFVVSAVFAYKKVKEYKNI